MPLATFVENIETLDEPVRGFYKETEGGFILDAEPVNGYAIENVEGLTSALAKERKARSDFEKQYKTLASKWDGMDEPDEIRAQLTKLEELSQFDPAQEADKIAEQKFENSKKRLETSLNKAWEAKWQNEHEPLKKQSEMMQAQLRKVMVDNEAVKAINAEGGDVDLLLPHVVSKVKFTQKDDGTFGTYVADADGEPMYNARGEYMTTQELVASYKDKFGMAFKSTAKPGTGIKPSTGGVGGVDISKLTPTQMIQEAIKQSGR